MTADIDYLHHIGHVVRDMKQALRVYHQLGFTSSHPACRTLARTPGEGPRPFGAANAHVEFARNFVELMTVVTDSNRIPVGARLVELQIPPVARQRVLGTIEQTVARIALRLARFEGLHRLVFHTPDIDASAACFDQNGVGHSGINAAQRELETATGVRLVPVRVIELDSQDVAEAQLAVADSPEEVQLQLHPNGAVDLVESILCVADPELGAFVTRYTRYLGREARRAESGCQAIRPGEHADAFNRRRGLDRDGDVASIGIRACHPSGSEAQPGAVFEMDARPGRMASTLVSLAISCAPTL